MELQSHRGQTQIRVYKAGQFDNKIVQNIAKVVVVGRASSEEAARWWVTTHQRWINDADTLIADRVQHEKGK